MATQNMFNPSSTHFLRFCLFLSSFLHISFLFFYLSVLCKKIFFTFLSPSFFILTYFLSVVLSVCAQSKTLFSFLSLSFVILKYFFMLVSLYLFCFFFVYVYVYLFLHLQIVLFRLFFICRCLIVFVSSLFTFLSLSFSTRTYFLSIYESLFVQYLLILLRFCVCIVFFPLSFVCLFL